MKTGVFLCLLTASVFLSGCLHESSVCNTTENEMYDFFKSNLGSKYRVVNHDMDQIIDDHEFVVELKDAGEGSFAIQEAGKTSSLAYKSFSTCSTQGHNLLEFKAEPISEDRSVKFRLALVTPDPRQANKFILRWLHPQESKLVQLGMPYDTHYSDGDPVHGIKMGIFVRNESFSLDDLLSVMALDKYETYTFEPIP